MLGDKEGDRGFVFFEDLCGFGGNGREGGKGGGRLEVVHISSERWVGLKGLVLRERFGWLEEVEGW